MTILRRGHPMAGGLSFTAILITEHLFMRYRLWAALFNGFTRTLKCLDDGSELLWTGRALSKEVIIEKQKRIWADLVGIGS